MSSIEIFHKSQRWPVKLLENWSVRKKYLKALVDADLWVRPVCRDTRGQTFLFAAAGDWPRASGRKLSTDTHSCTHVHTSKLLLNTAVGKQAVFRCPCLDLYTHINTHTQQTRTYTVGVFPVPHQTLLPQLVRLNKTAVLHTHKIHAPLWRRVLLIATFTVHD